jgi:hypothetical protein
MRVRGVALVGVLAGVAAGCGGPSQDEIRTEFRQKANRVCTTLQRDVPRGRPGLLLKETGADASRWHGAVVRTRRRVRALKPADDDRPKVRAFLDATAAQERQLAGLRDAGDEGELLAAQRLTRRLARTGAERRAAAQGAGLRQCARGDVTAARRLAVGVYIAGIGRYGRVERRAVRRFKRLGKAQTIAEARRALRVVDREFTRMRAVLGPLRPPRRLAAAHRRAERGMLRAEKVLDELRRALRERNLTVAEAEALDRRANRIGDAADRANRRLGRAAYALAT